MKFKHLILGCFLHSSNSETLARNGQDKLARNGQDKQMNLAATDGETVINSGFRVFSYNELKAATQGFSLKIGQGGFCSVYKGRLVGNDLVAVKVVSVEVESLRGEREFISEISALSDITHENLVTLRGCCIHGAHRFLVYDFMPNSSLNHTLFGNEQTRVKLSWELRKQVALGIARGLCFLHEQVRPRVVHRDIKPSNILLDHDFNPKIGDFGLAKLFRDNTSHISTRVAGTLGYLSPEYAHSGRLTRKSDVYSFGVLLLEIVSGRRVVDYSLRNGEQFLVEMAWEMYNAKNLVDLVDIVLKGEYPPDEAARFLKIGLLCVQEATKLRPEMSNVVKMLRDGMDAEEVEISWPGIVADLMEVKICKNHSSILSYTPQTSTTPTASLQAT